VAYAIPINKKWSFFDLAQACDLIKKFDKPVISLNPLADGKLLKESEEAFTFLFNELKIYLAIVEITSEDEVKTVLEAMEKIPSFIPLRKT
jgi:predicted aldo/keto reductase-like oxidoreductase